MEDKPARNARPHQVSLGVWGAVASAVLLIVSVYDALGSLHSVATREALQKTLGSDSARELGVTVAQATTVMHGMLLVAGAGAAVAVVLAVFALQRDRTARLVLSGLAVVVLIASTAADPLLALVLVFAVAMLWSRPARDWYAGREPARPPVALQESDGRSPEPDPSVQSDGPRPDPDRPDAQQPGQPEQPRPPVGPPPGPPPYAPPARPPAPAYGPPPQWPAGPPQGYGAPWAPVPPPYGPPPARPRVPATTRTALIITWVVSALTALAFLVVGAVASGSSDVLDRALDDARRSGSPVEITRSDLLAAMWVVVVLAIIWCVAACVLAWLAWRGHNWARIVLAVSTGVALLLSLILVVGSQGVSLVTLIACIAVLALLFSSSSNAWFSGRPPGPGQPHWGAPPGHHPGAGPAPGWPPAPPEEKSSGPSDPEAPERPSGKPPVW